MYLPGGDSKCWPLERVHPRSARLATWHWPNRTKRLMTAVVRMTLEDGERAVDLLKQHDAGEFVREGHLPNREVGVGGLAHCIAEAVRGADGEYQRLGVAVLMILQKFSKLF